MPADEVYRNWNSSVFNTGWVFHLSGLASRLLTRHAIYTASDSLMEWYQGFKPETAAAVYHNISGAFPNLNANRAKELARNTFASYGRGVIDYLRADFDPPRVVPVHDASGTFSVPGTKGRILVAAHLGNWEVGGIYIGKVVGRHYIIGFPERNRRVETLRRAKRQASGNVSLNTGLGPTTPIAIRRILDRGGNVVILVDRAIGKDNVEVRLNGRSTCFVKSPALLSALSGVSILPTAVMAEGNGLYSAFAGELIPPGDPGDPGAVMQRTADFFGAILERYPDQWYNFFEYWRERP